MDTNYVLTLSEMDGDCVFLKLDEPEGFAEAYGVLVCCEAGGEILERDFGGVKGAYLVLVWDADGGDGRDEGLLVTQEVANDLSVMERLEELFEERE